MNERLESLAVSFSDSIKDEMVSGVSELLETGLDAALEDGILKEIPIISLFVKLYNIGVGVRDRHNIIKLAAFIDGINAGEVSLEKRRRYQHRFREESKKGTTELEYILVLLDKYVGANKPRLLSKIYLAYLDEKIDWKEFAVFAEMLDRFLPGDIEEFIKIPPSLVFFSHNHDDLLLRMVALGLAFEERKTSTEVKGSTLVFNECQETSYKLTFLGLKLINILS